MSRRTIANGFREPAPPGEAGALIAYLDAVSDLPAVQEYKASTFHLLRLAAGDRVLDVGCGTGTDLLALAVVSGDVALVGCDFSPAMVAESSARAARAGIAAEIVLADAHDLPFASGSFTACRADRVVQHLAHPERAVEEMIRVTAAGGRIVISDPDWTSLRFEPATSGTERLVEARLMRARNPSVSRVVEDAFARAGIRDVCRHRVTARFTDLSIADAVLELRQAAEQEPELWADLARQEERGRFSAELEGDIVRGTIPQ